MTSSTDRRVGGRYELVRRIARGGGGTVWAGYDHVLERDVAVKHVPIPDDLPATEREVLRARVRSEARASARLLHPSAVAIFDVVADDGDVYLVLELVEDPTLDELVARDGPIAPPEVAAIGVRLLDVLMAAHERGIVHRDVKPGNIFVSADGEVKLTDFGIAALDGEARLTRTGATMGSPQFIAPEQALGHDAAPAADLWGLGASLYLAVEGAPPFERGNAIATVHAVVHEPARPVERAGRLGPILDRLLAKSPDARPDEAWLRSALGEVAGGASPPVMAATTPVVPVRSTPTAGAPGDAGSGGVGGRRGADASGQPPDRRDDREAGTAADDGRGPGRWVALVVAVVAAVVGVIALTGEDAGDDLGPEEVAAPDADGASPPGADADAGSVPEATDGDGAATERSEPDDAAGDEDADGDAAGDVDGDAGPGATALSDLEEAALPADWQVVEGAAYRVAVPADWEVDPGEGRRVDHRDPDSSTYLRVDWTPDPQPDPMADWEAMDRALAQRFEDYERIQLTEVTVRGEPAALLEYTYTAGGAALRAYNLNLLAGDRAYALNLQSQAQDWDEVEPMFAAILGGFEPTR